MIITEDYNGMKRTYSDQGVYIHGGDPEGDYTEAIDPINAGRTYTETDRKIEGPSMEDYAEAAQILLAVEDEP